MAPNFGKYAIVGSIEHTFADEPDWAWTIKPVTSGMELERSKFLLHNRLIETRDGVRREMPPTWLEIAHREIALTYGGTTIPKELEKPVSEGGEPLLPKEASVAEVESILRLMPQEMAMEIWKAIGEAYPEWGPSDPNSV